MDLCSLIRNKKQGLKPCKTTLTNMCGEKYEIVDGKLNYVEKGLPFVIDTKPDLQVAHISSGLFIGSQDPAFRIDILRNHDIRHILSVGIELELKFEGIQYYHIDLLDIPEADINGTLETCIRIIHCNRHENIFVHCNAGVSRSATVVIAYLMVSENLTYDQAYHKVKVVRNSIRPNEGFIRQLKALNPSNFLCLSKT